MLKVKTVVEVKGLSLTIEEVKFLHDGARALSEAYTVIDNLGMSDLLASDVALSCYPESGDGEGLDIRWEELQAFYLAANQLLTGIA
jgi:hypothetical protein